MHSILTYKLSVYLYFFHNNNKITLQREMFTSTLKLQKLTTNQLILLGL
jgi:hypothetical protein